MEHRHLLPDEIDHLLDGEAGFGVAPLMGHVEACSACRAELAEARQIVSALEREDLELDEALKLFEEGIGHLREAQSILNTAELRIEKLIENAAGVRTETMRGE